MKLSIIYTLSLAVGGLCNCSVQLGSKELKGNCQAKQACLQSGLAAISKNPDGEVLCASDESDGSDQTCCLDIPCGVNNGKCRNNVEGNACETGKYMANFRHEISCPSSSPEENLQCCVLEKPELRVRQFGDEDPFGEGASEELYAYAAGQGGSSSNSRVSHSAADLAGTTPVGGTQLADFPGGIPTGYIQRASASGRKGRPPGDTFSPVFKPRVGGAAVGPHWSNSNGNSAGLGITSSGTPVGELTFGLPRGKK